MKTTISRAIFEGITIEDNTPTIDTELLASIHREDLSDKDPAYIIESLCKMVKNLRECEELFQKWAKNNKPNYKED